MKLYDVYLSAQNGNSCITLMIYIFHELLDTIYIYDFKICYRKTNHLLKIFVYLRSRNAHTHIHTETHTHVLKKEKTRERWGEREMLPAGSFPNTHNGRTNLS